MSDKQPPPPRRDEFRPSEIAPRASAATTGRIGYILKTHLIVVLLVILVNIQWILPMQSEAIVARLERMNFIGLVDVFFAFHLLLIFVFLHKELKNCSVVCEYIFVFVLIELSTANLVPPMQELFANVVLWQKRKMEFEDYLAFPVCALFTFIILVLSAAHSLYATRSLYRTIRQFVSFTIALFVLSSAGTILCLSTDNTYLALVWSAFLVLAMMGVSKN